MASSQTTPSVQSSVKPLNSPAHPATPKDDPDFDFERSGTRAKKPDLDLANAATPSEADGWIAAIEAMEQERPGESRLAVIGLIAAALVAALLAAAVVGYFAYPPQPGDGIAPTRTLAR